MLGTDGGATSPLSLNHFSTFSGCSPSTKPLSRSNTSSSCSPLLIIGTQGRPIDLLCSPETHDESVWNIIESSESINMDTIATTSQPLIWAHQAA